MVVLITSNGKWLYLMILCYVDTPSSKRKKFESESIPVESFSKSISDCTNNFKINADEKEHVFVDLDRVVSEVIAVIYDQIPRITTNTYRVPPLALMRLARGGKTRTISSVFDQLKCENLVHPILISFNGSGPTSFARRDGETQSQAFFQLIAAQLTNYTPKQAQNLVVDPCELDIYLGDNDVVVLADELNNLGLLDKEIAGLLRQFFLDKPHRFLVFTSHYPLSIEADTISASDVLGKVGTAPSSLRNVSTVNMSLASTDVEFEELLHMSTSCEALTVERAAWLGYIPSLIYCTMNDTGVHGVVTPSARFRQMNITIPPDEMLDVCKRFVRELLTGDRDAVVGQYYSPFQSVGHNHLVSYPLCYIREIFRQLRIVKIIDGLLHILNKLEAHLDTRHSGMDWECTVKVAIVLKMLATHWFGFEGPFDLVPPETRPALDMRTLPNECDTIEDASERMNTWVATYTTPTLIFVDSATAKYPQVEGFLIYTAGDGTSKKKGFQMKKSDTKPASDMDLNFINDGAVLIRGREQSKNPRNEPLKGWTYMTAVEVRDFLGNSLLLAIPRDLLQDP